MIRWLKLPFEFLCPKLSRSLVRKARTALQGCAEALWTLGFGIAGRLHKPMVKGWAAGGRQRVLVVAPHPDDEAIGCGGTIIRHKINGDEVCVAYITDGRQSQALSVGPDAMACQRKKEAESAALTLGIDRFEWIGLPEEQWSDEDLRSRLRVLLNEFAPHIIYAPSRIDNHSQHRKVAHALGSLLGEPELGHPVIRVYQIQTPLTPVLTNLVVDTSAVVKQICTVLDQYATQFGSTCRAPRKWRYASRYYQTKTHAEEFWEMTAQQYHMLGRLAPENWSESRHRPFRALQFRPYRDPIAYLWGISERKRLSRLFNQLSCTDRNNDPAFVNAVLPGKARQRVGRSCCN